MTALDRNPDVVEYPPWDGLPGATRRDWALFFGQDIAAHEVLNPPMQILAEFQEDIPMGMQREFPLGQRRACPDMCGRQTCRRPHCECVHPDFVDHAWVPLNSPCRNFFRGHCHKEGGCPNLHADTFPEAVYAAFRQLTMKRPSTRLHYVQHRSIFRFVTRSEAMDMIQAPSFGQPSEPQPSTASAEAPPVKPMPKAPPAHLAAPKRTPSPRNKQPARQRAQQPGSCRKLWTTWWPQNQRQHHPAKLLPLCRRTRTRAATQCRQQPPRPGKHPRRTSTPLHRYNSGRQLHLLHQQPLARPKHRPHHWCRTTTIL